MVSNMDAYLLEVEVHNRDEVQGVRVVVVIWITIAVIHPELDQPAFTWHHVNCMTTWVRYSLLHRMKSRLNRQMCCVLCNNSSVKLYHNSNVIAGHPLDVLCLQHATMRLLYSNTVKATCFAVALGFTFVLSIMITIGNNFIALCKEVRDSTICA